MRDLAGQRFIESAQYRNAREGGSFRDGNRMLTNEIHGVEVLDTAEIIRAMRLRTFSHLAVFDIDGVPYVGEAPTAAHVHQAVETIPTEGLQVELATESAETAFATAVEDGTPYPEVALSFADSTGGLAGSSGGSATTPALQKLPRVGLSAPVTLSQLDEPGIVSSLINRRLNAGIGLGLDNDMLTGNTFWESFITQAAAPSSPVAKGSTYRAFAIRNAVADVQTAGWYERQLQVVLHPTTAAALFEEEDGSQRPLAIMDMFDETVDAWIVSNAMPVGEALVGDLFSAAALFVKGPLTVGISRDHMDFRVRSMVMMTLGFRAFAWVRQPSALCVVTGL